MIVLHKLNGEEFVLNMNHIETIEQKPDTIITLTNERKYIVQESPEEIIHRAIEYQKRLAMGVKKD